MPAEFSSHKSIEFWGCGTWTTYCGWTEVMREPIYLNPRNYDAKVSVESCGFVVHNRKYQTRRKLCSHGSLEERLIRLIICIAADSHPGDLPSLGIRHPQLNGYQHSQKLQRSYHFVWRGPQDLSTPSENHGPWQPVLLLTCMT